MGPGLPVPVYCDMSTDGHVWTVFQKRFNGSVSFFRGWNDYRYGFGRADGEYWLGLQTIHVLTLQGRYELRVELEDFENNTASATYGTFALSPNAISAEEDGYTLHVGHFVDGGAGDSLSYHHGSPCVPMGPYGSQWVPMGPNGSLWSPTSCPVATVATKGLVTVATPTSPSSSPTGAGPIHGPNVVEPDRRFRRSHVATTITVGYQDGRRG
eukprot:XP_025002103.1 microfibril-associated glycoprotein 4-like [Gallus gallus]